MGVVFFISYLWAAYAAGTLETNPFSWLLAILIRVNREAYLETPVP